MDQTSTTSPPSLRYGRQMVATPGPSVIPDRVLAAMAKPMPNMYQGEILDITDRLLATLPTIARTTAPTFVVIANGHGAWQMAICNTLSRGDKILALESGRFAVFWGEMAAISGVEVEVLPGTDNDPVDPAAVQARLAADTDHEIKAIMVVQTDTATSVKNDLAAIRAAIDAANHPALYMADCIASLGCDRFEMDEWGIDVTVAGCQKGLMVPPGVSFVWASEKAMAAYESADLRTGYFDWDSRLNAEAHYQIFAGTPPIPHLYGLDEALSMIEEEGGIEAVWDRHQVLGDAVRAAVDTWSKPGFIESNIQIPAARSNAVTTVLTGSADAIELARICNDLAGLTLGIAIGEFAGRAVRIAHMGHLNPPMILGTLGTVEAALKAMDVPLGGSGVAAAVDVISEALNRSA
ncbi:MAG: pyridoxal-phosphate-dependent aminotransferase family protein [Acidimicrobiales bacterium]